MAEENQEDSKSETVDVAEESGDAESSSSMADAGEPAAVEATAGEAADPGVKRAHRSQKVGAVVSDKMQKTVVVRVDRLVRHTKYRRYVRRTSKFMAHDELGATMGDKVRIVETRPMSAKKRWRVIEIVQKAAK
ncbi:MAG TPA: 30S ribosomal protein S17 [Pyrinomonadaceae bacterium]|nr:30S ribosomal protein S17 [Pyrinomonadaceae bacterium]